VFESSFGRKYLENGKGEQGYVEIFFLVAQI